MQKRERQIHICHPNKLEQNLQQSMSEKNMIHLESRNNLTLFTNVRYTINFFMQDHMRCLSNYRHHLSMISQSEYF